MYFLINKRRVSFIISPPPKCVSEVITVCSILLPFYIKHDLVHWMVAFIVHLTLTILHSLHAINGTNKSFNPTKTKASIYTIALDTDTVNL